MHALGPGADRPRRRPVALSVSLGQQSSTSIGGGVAGKPVTATVNITYVRTVDGVESTVPQPPVHFQVLRQA